MPSYEVWVHLPVEVEVDTPIEALKQVRELDHITIATSTDSADVEYSLDDTDAGDYYYIHREEG